MSDTRALLERFAAAWNAHDAEELMACMTDDCVFYGSAGPGERGAEYRGRSAVREAYASIWQTHVDAAWNDPKHFVAGDRAVSEWIFTGTNKDGKRIRVSGCDVFTLRDGKIAVKDSFRKQN